jgi:Leucine Rich repeats (2 copies)
MCLLCSREMRGVSPEKQSVLSELRVCVCVPQFFPPVYSHSVGSFLLLLCTYWVRFCSLLDDKKKKKKEAKRKKKGGGSFVMDMSRNDLMVIPPEVWKLRKLEVLNLYYNCIKVIPPEIGKLTNLTRLGLNENQISQLPKEIGKLKVCVVCHSIERGRRICLTSSRVWISCLKCD